MVVYYSFYILNTGLPICMVVIYACLLDRPPFIINVCVSVVCYVCVVCAVLVQKSVSLVSFLGVGGWTVCETFEMLVNACFSM